MAAKSPSSSAGGGGDTSDGVQSAAGGGTVVINSVKWNPFTSPDWDNERHSREALVRIKRY